MLQYLLSAYKYSADYVIFIGEIIPLPELAALCKNFAAIDTHNKLITLHRYNILKSIDDVKTSFGRIYVHNAPDIHIQRVKEICKYNVKWRPNYHLEFSDGYNIIFVGNGCCAVDAQAVAAIIELIINSMFSYCSCDKAHNKFKPFS